MRFTHTCIITKNINELKEFYKEVLQKEPSLDVGIYIEFLCGEGKLALFKENAHNELAPNSALGANNRSIMIEFEVANVDKEYERLLKKDIVWVKGPTNQVWGNRSIYFRDVDDNLISFYTKI